MDIAIGIIVVLGVLIFFHEFGHFVVAKAFGVGVEKFSLGFGPKIVGKKIGRTEYCLSAFPLGGYVKLVGEEPDVELPPEDIPYSFTEKSVPTRMAIVAAGPLFNLILPIIIFFAVFTLSGLVMLKPVVGNVASKTPAADAGLKKGDQIVSINKKPIENWSEMADRISHSKGKPLEFSVRRDGRLLTLEITPQKKAMKDIFGQNHERFVVGIAASGEIMTQRLSPYRAFIESFHRTYLIIKLTILSVVKVVQGVISVKTLGGPILIAQIAGNEVHQGLISLLSFIALVSVNLGILNLLPVPVLDGGHLLFFSIEAIKGRPVSLKTRETAQQIGIFLLIMLMILVFYNDIMRIIAPK